MSEQQYISKITNKKHGNTESYIIRDEAAWTEIEKLKKQLGDLLAECDAYKVQPVNSIESITTTSDPTKWQINYTAKGPVAISVPIGIPGEPGAPGTEGRPGEDGKTYVPSYDSESGELSWKIGDLDSGIDHVIIKGEKGDKGNTGDTGERGPEGSLPANIVTVIPDSAEADDEVLYVGKSQNRFEFGQTYIYTTCNITTTLASPVKISSYSLLDKFFSKLKNSGYNNDSITITYTSDCNDLSDFFSGYTYGENDPGYSFTLNGDTYVVNTSDIGILYSNTEDPHSYTITKKTSNFWIPKFKLN